jgi:uncharacterized RDD family membrane protein YckC
MACTNHPEQVIDLVRCSRCGEEFCRDCVIELKEKLFCANCKREQVRDIQSGADSNALELASIGRRFWALVIDFIVICMPIAIAYSLYIFGTFDRAMSPRTQNPFSTYNLTLVAIMNVVYILYEAVMLQARGQTLGKMALGIKVVTPEGEDISTGQAWGRAFGRMVFSVANAFLGIVFLVNYLPAFFSKEKKAVHDSLAKTRVIRCSS